MSTLSHGEKLRLLSDLIRLASADAEHPAEEYDYLHRVAEQLQVDPMEMELLFTSVDTHPAPEAEDARIVLFFHLLEMVGIDGELSNDEIHVLRELGMRLALRIQGVDQCIATTRLYLPKLMSLEEVRAVFSQLRN